MKSGFVVLAGRSNVGKSTLINTLVGTKVAIVTPKAQTTRQPIRGILHDPRGQIVFVDTPGVFLGKKDILSKKLNKTVKENLEGIDAVCYVVDPVRPPGKEEEKIQALVKSVNVPLLIIINKSDVEPQKRPYTDHYKHLAMGQKNVITVSALKQKNIKELINLLFEILPDGERFYPDRQITDLGHQQWLEEVIREKVFLVLEQELPYTVHITVNDVKFRKQGGRFIDATVWTTAERYKRMIIGKSAQTIKRIGMMARKELELALNTPVHLELEVKVDPKWPERFQAL